MTVDSVVTEKMVHFMRDYLATMAECPPSPYPYPCPRCGSETAECKLAGQASVQFTQLAHATLKGLKLI